MESPTNVDHFVMWWSKVAVSALAAAPNARRHISAGATLRIKCGAPHLMRQSRTPGSEGEVPGDRHLYPTGRTLLSRILSAFSSGSISAAVATHKAPPCAPHPSRIFRRACTLWNPVLPSAGALLDERCCLGKVIHRLEIQYSSYSRFVTKSLNYLKALSP